MVRTERWPCRRTHWIGSVACLHNAYILTREPAFAPQIGTLLVRPWVIQSWSSRLLRRVNRAIRHLHHHLPGAGGIHLPAPAQRAWSADRARAPALRPLFGPRYRTALDQRQCGGAARTWRRGADETRRAGRAASGTLEGHSRG